MKKLIALLMLLPSLSFAEMTIPRSDFANEMEKSLPNSLCMPSQVFMSCFKTDKNGCKNVMKIVTQECIKGLGIPENIPVSEAANWGTPIGQCVAKAYMKAMTDAGHRKASCQ